ncbi:MULTISPECIES: hypothetical protein [unclassified Streptomyces]|uniref:hypothetical protein n=1 Tax=unclassified Streptomyces TaxID=2593676 RepID=UPI000DC7AF4A|nr:MULTISPECIES: hypothetical protein [unclassified Streptomyces]AWZ06094.1 hypothetical protein DRB89_17350 [Streptomyces sp. ICC4]AWZ12811.1 hypothetical protein DRB96_11250 [Streptomyces sp. ICC1]
MVNWAQMYDWHSDVDRVPELLDRVERGDGGEAWTELGHRLILERDLVSLAGIAALPRLVRLAARSTEARHLAGEIMERAAGRHGGDDLLVGSVDSIAEFGILLDRHLQSRPADYLVTFRALLAVREQYHWANVLGDFADDFYDLPCPHCATQVTVAIGDYGRYSAIRDWNRGDVDLRDLRPASIEKLSGVGRWMHEMAVRDGEAVLAEGISHLFGRAECPRCASVFTIADEYEAANCPVLR